MIGQFIAHYKILGKIGEGGMGVVYKAEDTKLKRSVALKFLPAELTKDPQAKARFIQEARAAAALDHPNICAVYEIGEAKGATYIAMPYVKGQSLKEKIAAGPLSIEETMDIAGQIAEGLKEAHEKGIVHRDIKPANIMLTEKGQAKIMDFGLAKLTSVAEVTKTLTVMGTIAYMSPEQAKGEAVDQQTDIWSFGATLYEILTGQMPFGHKRDQALIFSILNDTADPVSRHRPEIPNSLEKVVQKALEKDKSRRYQNMAELLRDLKAAREAGFVLPKAEKSIIVLPFEDISPGKDNEYFSDGLTEEIITDLSHVHDLLVISRSSAMTFKGSKKTIPEIARAVNVRYVLEGSVRKAGNNLRITAQLIDSTNDAHLWAEKYSGTLEDIFDIQEKVSRSIVDALKIKLTPQDKEKMIARLIDNAAAYDLHIRARYEIWQGTAEGRDRARELVDQALAILGENEVLYADMAYILIMYMDTGFMKDAGTFLKAEELIQKVFALNPDSAYGHYLKGMIERKKGRTQEAVREFKKSLALDPANPDSMMWLGWVYSHSGKTMAARPIVKRLLDIDPLTPLNQFFAAGVTTMEGEFDRALGELQAARRTQETNPLYLYWQAKCLAYSLRLEEAKHLFDLIPVDPPATPWAQLGSFFVHALEKNNAEALQPISEDFKLMMKGDEIFPIWMAESYALIDEKSEAIDWLETGINCGFINYPFLMEYDRFLANLHDEPRFQKLMERVKYEWERFEV